MFRRRCFSGFKDSAKEHGLIILSLTASTAAALGVLSYYFISLQEEFKELRARQEELIARQEELLDTLSKPMRRL